MKPKELPSQERLNEVFEYNPETGELITKIGRYRRRAGEVVGSRTSGGYLDVGVDNGLYKAHRLIWVLVHGSIPEGRQLDHINGVKDDNRLSNLRVVTPSENNRNRRMRSDNTSGVCGVAWFPRYNKWVAQIMEDGRNKNLGYFDTLEEAAKARKQAEEKFNYHPNHGYVGQLQRTV